MTMRVKGLAFSPVPIEGAGCRFRIAQYLPYLASRGIDLTIDPFLSPSFFRLVYKPGQYLRKTGLTVDRILQRFRRLASTRHYDFVLVYREALPVGPPIVEHLLSAWQKRPIVYDFDDAVFLPNVSEANRLVAALKWPSKIATIVRRSTQVIAGNQYLADYARQYSEAVRIIPTCVDTKVFVPQASIKRSGSPVIGWIGTPSTAGYLQSLAPTLARLAQRRPFTLHVSGTDGPLNIPQVTVRYVDWSLAGEVSLFNGCDVGIYPLTDDPWTRGKCGFKAIQFMACGVPVVAAAVGVNREILSDGVNGFLASTQDEWVEKLDGLLAHRELRHTLGQAGRRTVEERYSLAVNAPRFEAAIRDALECGG